MPRTRNLGRNTAQQDDFIRRGRAAALTGIGLTDPDQKMTALDQACGGYALMDRSAWLVGHVQGVRTLDALALDASVRAVAQDLSSRGLTVSRRGLSFLDVSDGPLIYRVDVQPLDPAAARHHWSLTGPPIPAHTAST